MKRRARKFAGDGARAIHVDGRHERRGMQLAYL